ncbi:MAG TPA: DNA-directed RNA polymerase subunit omega [Campylobacterales bacterium]|nr:DNA-directed RNA polymerase subunit omega [Campylobacterales bacterium]HIO70995.1 DNA-directed RNA polymerase subunit omega [Campylobacterales bacterium]
MAQRLEKAIAKALKVVDGDTYLLSIIVAKRSEEITNGAEPKLSEQFLKSHNITKSADIALYELAENKLDFKIV